MHCARNYRLIRIMKQTLRLLRRYFRTLIGQDYFEHTDICCPVITIGNAGANWTINPELVSADSIVYSVGIGEDISFDLSMIKKYGVTIHAFDPTPKSLAWLARQDLPPQFIAHPVGLSDEEGTLKFYPPANDDWVSHSLIDNKSGREALEVPVKPLASLMEDLSHEHIDILKMDIEGAEYSVIEALVTSPIRPGMLLVEFHHRFPEQNIRKTQNAISSLRKVGYKVFHVSDNGEEVSFMLN